MNESQRIEQAKLRTRTLDLTKFEAKNDVVGSMNESNKTPIINLPAHSKLTSLFEIQNTLEENGANDMNASEVYGAAAETPSANGVDSSIIVREGF